MQMLNRHQSDIDTNTCISADWTKAHINHFGSLSNTIPKVTSHLSNNGWPYIRLRCPTDTHVCPKLWWRHQMETFSALLAFVRGIHRSPVNSPHKGQWRGALMFSFICRRINGWVNNLKAGDLWRLRGHYDVTVSISQILVCLITI